MKCVCVCVYTHSTVRDQASDTQRAHFPNVNISVKACGVRVNRILLNCERLRAPLSRRWHRARGGSRPLPPRFLQHCPLIKGKPPTAFSKSHNIPSLPTIPPKTVTRRLFRLYLRGCLARGRTPPSPFTASENSQAGQKHHGGEQTGRFHFPFFS